MSSSPPTSTGLGPSAAPPPHDIRHHSSDDHPPPQHHNDDDNDNKLPFSADTIKTFLDQLEPQQLLQLYSNLNRHASPCSGNNNNSTTAVSSSLRSTSENLVKSLIEERVEGIVNSVWELPQEESTQIGPHHWVTELSYDKYLADVRHLAGIYRSLLGVYSNIEDAATEYRGIANRVPSASPFCNSATAAATCSSFVPLAQGSAQILHCCPHRIPPTNSSSSSSAVAAELLGRPLPRVTYTLPATVSVSMRLPPTHDDDDDTPTYSRKVFAGGFPTNATVDQIHKAFTQFGSASSLQILLPSNNLDHIVVSKGFCYLLFHQEEEVCHLMRGCERNELGYYRSFEGKRVQIIPWCIRDSECSTLNAIHTTTTTSSSSCPATTRSAPHGKDLTVFVGALHGTITASMLFLMMEQLFGNVVHAALDTDRYHYPVGSGRVTFRTVESYRCAVKCNLLHVRGVQFEKTIQLDPYLEDSMCSWCHMSPGVYFCRSEECFNYYCPPCWQICHAGKFTNMTQHTPLRRTFNFLSE